MNKRTNNKKNKLTENIKQINMNFLIKATSNIEEFNQGRRFQKVYPETYPDSLVEPEKIRRVILCSGQVYYDLLEKRREEKITVYLI